MVSLFVTLIIAASLTGAAVSDYIHTQNRVTLPPVTVFNGKSTVNTYSNFGADTNTNVSGFYSNVTSFANQSKYAPSSFHVNSFVVYFVTSSGFEIDVIFVAYATFSSDLHPVNLTLNASDRGLYDNYELYLWELDLNRTGYNFTEPPPVAWPGLILNHTTNYPLMEPGVNVTFSNLNDITILGNGSQTQYVTLTHEPAPSNSNMSYNFLFITQFTIDIAYGTWQSVHMFTFVFTINGLSEPLTASMAYGFTDTR